MRAKRYVTNSRRRGSSLVETAAGMFLIIPVVLFFIDVGAAVMAQMANDALAKQAARSAAQASSQANADSAAKTTVENYFSSCQSSMYVVPPGGSGAPDTAITLPTNYNPMSAGIPSGVVTVTTNIVCNLPVPVGTINSVPFAASATEPILAKLPGAP